ncbi:MAG TPA: hypothetical protein VGE07_18255, partial [Herpetosiphonaceae bacterium]
DRGLALRAARLFAAAAAIREEAGAPPERPWLDGRLALLRARLSDETWESAWAAGRALPREPAMAEALDDGDTDR